jgi:HEAT repeat protein
MQPSITTTITCVTCGGTLSGGDRDFIVRCPYCGAEYQVSIAVVTIAPADVEAKIQTLIACALGGNPQERDEACLELAKIRDARVVAPVLEAVRELSSRIEDYIELEPAIDSLKRIITGTSDPAATEILTGALSDPSLNIRQTAAFALENLADPSSAEALIRAAQDRDPYVRSAVVGALGSVDGDGVDGALLKALEDTDYGVKKSALRALGRHRCHDALAPALAILADNTSTSIMNGIPWPEVRMWSAYALGEIREAAATEALVAAAGGEDPGVRQFAEAALRKIRSAAGDESIET